MSAELSDKEYDSLCDALEKQHIIVKRNGLVVLRSSGVVESQPCREIVEADKALWEGVVISFNTSDGATALVQSLRDLLRQVAWELHESIFRFQLMRLDKDMTALSTFEYRVKRARAIRACFPGPESSPLLEVKIPNSVEGNQGLASGDISVRRPYLARLAELMLSWRVKLDPVGVINEADSPVAILEAAEASIVRHYCRAHCLQYGYVPTPPTRLF